MGDVVEKRDVVLGGPVLLALAGPANRQGRMAADAIFGADVKFRGVQGTSVCGLFDLTVSSRLISDDVVVKSGCLFVSLRTRAIRTTFAKIQCQFQNYIVPPLVMYRHSSVVVATVVAVDSS